MGRDLDQAQGEFNQAIYGFSPLPVNLGIEPHDEEDGSVLVRCAMGVASIEEAEEVANEVISQILWRVALRPIDLEDGEGVDEVRFEIVDLQGEGDQSED